MKTPVLALLAAVVLAACSGGNKDESATDTAAMAPAPAPATPAAPAVTDPQIAAIVVAANNVDIAGGKMAQAKSKNASVKSFGKMMVTDHSAVNTQATNLVKKLNVTPEESETSRGMTDKGKATSDSLSKMSGAAFDKAYIDNEVAYHQQVLDAIDKTLIPNAQNAELKALLEQTRPAVAAHLKSAQDIQSKLNTSK
jgi:putative membrane protein